MVNVNQLRETIGKTKSWQNLSSQTGCHGGSSVMSSGVKLVPLKTPDLGLAKGKVHGLTKIKSKSLGQAQQDTRHVYDVSTQTQSGMHTGIS